MIKVLIPAGGSLLVDQRGSGGWDVSARGQVKGTMLKHGGGQVADQRKGLGMKVAEHGIGFPTADQTDGVAIDFSAE